MRSSVNELAWVRQLEPHEFSRCGQDSVLGNCLVRPTSLNLGMAVSMGGTQTQPGCPQWVECDWPEAICVLSGRVEVRWQHARFDVVTQLSARQICYLPPGVPRLLSRAWTDPGLFLSFRVDSRQLQRAGIPAAVGPPWIRTMTPAELTGLPGVAGRWKCYVQPSSENHGMTVGLGELPPRTRMSYHLHADSELFYVQRGCGRAFWEIEGVEHGASLIPGSAFFNVGKVRHLLENTGNEPMLGLTFNIQPLQ